jgi:hypothetical protein
MKIVELRPYSWDSDRVYIVFVGFRPCLHRIRGIPIVFTSHSWDCHRVYIVFVEFPPCLHRVRGIPIVFTSHSWDSHRVYIVFVGFPSCLHRIHGIPTVFTSYSGDSESRNPPISLDKCVYAWYSSLYFFSYLFHNGRKLSVSILWSIFVCG